MKPTSLKLVLVAAAALLLTSCTVTFLPDDQAPVQQTPVTRPSPVAATPQSVPNFAHNQVMEYECVGGRQLVTYNSNESAQVFAGGEWLTLTRTVSSDGWFVYKDNKYTWYARRNDGYLERNGEIIARDCRI